MPTYRDYNLDKQYNNYFLPPIDFEKWEKHLSREYVLVIRFHYLIDRFLDIPKTTFFINASNYEDVNDLYAVADVLISDYSSTYVDYSVLERPMVCFGYDYDHYKKWRGFELDFEKAIPCSIDRTEDELLKHIENMDYEEYVQKAKQFHNRFAKYAGHATEAVVDELKKRILD